MNEIVLDSPLDMHLHLRDGEMLKKVARYTTDHFSGAIVMPNLNPPVDSVERMESYKREIFEASGSGNFIPYMALFFRDDLKESELIKAKESGSLIVKLYPKGATTNSESGSSEILSAENRRIFAMMQEVGLKLSIHGETNGFVMEREAEFLPIYEEIAREFPKLGVIIEHMSTKKALDSLKKYENLTATITLHHIELTLDDVMGGAFNPHHFCKPNVKTPEDRDALLEAALNADSKVCFGSDSAPHPREKKECARAAAGIFTTPIALPYLAHIFDKHGKIENLQKFVSDNARAIYGITPLKKEVKLFKKDMVIEEGYNGIVPMGAGRTIRWSF